MTEIFMDSDPQPVTQAYLIQTNPGRHQVVELKDFITVGRDHGNHLLLADPTVSGRHARIEKREDGFYLRDQNSRNGVFVNGRKIVEARLKPQDQIALGQSQFMFTENMGVAEQLQSRNEAWNTQLKRLSAFANTDFPVLILGNSGTGKELLAKAVHEQSRRSAEPFLTINCSALTENLIESELFGHMRGSFTGALNDRKGAFEMARGGTLFLDEIGDLPLAIQPKLLRAIENQEIRPVGSDRTVSTDVRIVAATHKNLRQMVYAKDFRDDLYFRLNVCQINPPRLTERIEDFEDLLFRFAKDLRVRFSVPAIQRMKCHSWPGNIRELRNVVARAAAFYHGQNISAEQIEPLLEPDLAQATLVEPSASRLSLIKEIERDMIVQRLIANRGNQRRTALDLGLPKSTLHDRIRTYKIDVDAIAKGS